MLSSGNMRLGIAMQINIALKQAWVSRFFFEWPATFWLWDFYNKIKS